jgi:tetratricopeptide (TPR) repeat protein
MRNLVLVVLLWGVSTPAWAQIFLPDGEAYNRSYGAENVADYRKALRELDGLSPTGKATYFFELRRGWLLYLSGQYEDSIEAYKKASQRTTPQALEPMLGEILPLMALRRWKDASDTARRVLGLDPSNSIALSRVAWSEYNLGRFASSESYYRKYLELYPSDLDMRVGLGWALFQQGKKKLAEAEFRAVLDVAPGHSSGQQGWAASRAQ